jgi:hypothetical protein
MNDINLEKLGMRLQQAVKGVRKNDKEKEVRRTRSGEKKNPDCSGQLKHSR